MTMGPPFKYKPEYVEQVKKLAALGATDNEMADFFGVHRATFYEWRSRYPEFTEAMKIGKGIADDRVERSLYQKANGYEIEVEELFCHQGEVIRATTKKYFPPDTTSCIFWLKNRRQHEWRDVHKIEHGRPGEFSEMSDEELNAFIAREQRSASASDSGKASPRSAKTPSGARRLN